MRGENIFEKLNYMSDFLLCPLLKLSYLFFANPMEQIKDEETDISTEAMAWIRICLINLQRMMIKLTLIELLSTLSGGTASSINQTSLS